MGKHDQMQILSRSCVSPVWHCDVSRCVLYGVAAVHSAHPIYDQVQPSIQRPPYMIKCNRSFSAPKVPAPPVTAPTLSYQLFLPVSPRFLARVSLLLSVTFGYFRLLSVTFCSVTFCHFCSRKAAHSIETRCPCTCVIGARCDRGTL